MKKKFNSLIIYIHTQKKEEKDVWETKKKFINEHI